MPTQTLLAILKQQLAACQLSGTSITESGITVSTNRLPEEIIFFFRTDSEAGRAGLGMAGDAKACDCLVFYAKKDEIGELLCLLELKAADIGAAKEQIKRVHEKVKQLIITHQLQHIILTACICMRHQAPAGDMHHIKELRQIFGKGNVHLKSGVKKYTELGSFLRKQLS